jgi:hypothetical protein
VSLAICQVYPLLLVPVRVNNKSPKVIFAQLIGLISVGGSCGSTVFVPETVKFRCSLSPVFPLVSVATTRQVYPPFGIKSVGVLFVVPEDRFNRGY